MVRRFLVMSPGRGWLKTRRAGGGVAALLTKTTTTLAHGQLMAMGLEVFHSYLSWC